MIGLGPHACMVPQTETPALGRGLTNHFNTGLAWSYPGS